MHVFGNTIGNNFFMNLIAKNEALTQVKNKTLSPEKNLPKSSLISES